jgi:hypothetical protein
MILDLRKCLGLGREYALCAAVGLSIALGCPGRAESQGGQWYFIKAVTPGICWDVRFQDIANGQPGAEIQQMNCNGSKYQAFYITAPTESPVRGIRQILTYFTRQHRVFGLAQVVPGGPSAISAVNSAPTRSSQWGIETGPANNVIYIVHIATHLYADRVTQTLNPGAPLRITQFSGGVTQQWVLQQVTDPKLLAELNSRVTK